MSLSKFKLEERRQYIDFEDYVYREEDVKELIKQIEEIKIRGLDETCKRLMLKEIYKLAGDKLI